MKKISYVESIIFLLLPYPFWLKSLSTCHFHRSTALSQSTIAFVFVRAMNVSMAEEGSVINALETFEAAKTIFETAVKNLEDAVAAEASVNNENPFVINALKTVKAAKTALDTAAENLRAAEATEAAVTAEAAIAADAPHAPETTVNTSNATNAGIYTNRCINAYKAAERSLFAANRDLRTAQNADALAKKQAKEDVINARAAFKNATELLATAKKALRAAEDGETAS